MSKPKTNALEALRALIAERQQYEQWISAVESKRAATAPHVFERVQADYKNRLDRVVGDIRGHAEELQLSINALSSRLVEVARDEDVRRDAMQEAELRAAVGEYETAQWEQMRNEAQRELEKIAANRGSLDNQLAELRSIQKLSDVGGGDHAEDRPRNQAGAADSVRAAEPTRAADSVRAAEPSPSTSRVSSPVAEERTNETPRGGGASAAPPGPAPSGTATRQVEVSGAEAFKPPLADAQPGSQQSLGQDRLGREHAATRTPTPPGGTRKSGRTPPGGVNAPKGGSTEARPAHSKTLKCPQCGTANHPTEWYCEHCGGELATM